MSKFELVAYIDEDNKVCIDTTNDGFDAFQIMGILEMKKSDILAQINPENKFDRKLVRPNGDVVNISEV